MSTSMKTSARCAKVSKAQTKRPAVEVSPLSFLLAVIAANICVVKEGSHWCSRSELGLRPAYRRFSLPKCCAMHEWPLWRAAPQHLKVVVNGRFGPRGQNSRMARAVGEVPTTSLGSRQLDATLVIGFEKPS